jgi:uncharacterized protein (TIGR03437 family)
MRWNGCPITIALAAALASVAAPAHAASFGTVVPIGGQAADIALDETRNKLYIANFTASRIDVMSTANYAINSSMVVAPQPGALALSHTGANSDQYLLVAHYGQWGASDPTKNLVTLIDLNTSARQTFVTGDPALGVAFLKDDISKRDMALIVTTTSIMLMDPVSGAIRVMGTLADLASLALPAKQATFPGQIVQTACAVSGDGYVAWCVGDAGTSPHVVIRYDQRYQRTSVILAAATPALLPRVSVNQDGSRAMIGYAVFGATTQNGIGQSGAVVAQYPDVVASLNVTGHAIDPVAGTVYAQIPDATQPVGPPYASAASGGAPSTSLPGLYVMDLDNLTPRDRLGMPESIVGRALLSANGKTMYAISDSGVMALPVGSLNQYPRLATSVEDVQIQTSFCNRNVITSMLTITDPGGGNTDFTISVSQKGVTVSPVSGKTPATVQIRVDPSAFQNQTGTTAVALRILSNTAVNAPPTVRLLISNPNPDQRGSVVNVPGRLSDMLADPSRNRIYLLRQDANQLLVYDGTSYSRVATLRTATTPTRMAFSVDRKYLIVGHDNAQVANVYDLDALQQTASIPLPFGQYLRSIAESNASTLGVARLMAAPSASGGSSACVGCDSPLAAATIDRIDLGSRTAAALASLGIWQNLLPSEQSALAPSANGASILLAEPDGNIKLYSAAADSFVASRKDFAALQGAIAASSYESYVVGDNILNKSLAPTGAFAGALGGSSGFAFVNQGGFRTTGGASANPGVIQNFAALDSASVKPTPMVEGPLGPGLGVAFTRTVAPLATGTVVAALTTSGFTVLSWNYDAAVAPPSIAAVTSAADGTAPVAPGGLISIWGQQMSPVNMATKQMPLPTALGESCVVVNGSPIPLLFVSSQQINAQLPFNVGGTATLAIRTPGGMSDNFYFTVYPTAPSVFRSGTAGPLTGLATIVRYDNNELVTPTNPLHANDIVTVYLTGMGATTPPVDSGLPGPVSPLAWTSAQAALTLGGHPMEVTYAGMAPGMVGVYQINATVPYGAPQGLEIPLSISQGGIATQIDVSVVK